MSRLLLTVASSFPCDGSAEYALVSLVPAQARKLLELHRRGRAFLAEIARDALVSEFFAPSFGLSSPAFIALRSTDELDALMSPATGGVLVLDDAFFIDAESDDKKVEVEAFRVFLRDGSITFTSLPKNGDGLLTTASIPIELLIRLANSAG